jgi:hypothetical protein
VTNATGGFVADTNAAEKGVRKLALGDGDALGGFEERLRLHPTAGLDGNAIVAGQDTAAAPSREPAPRGAMTENRLYVTYTLTIAGWIQGHAKSFSPEFSPGGRPAHRAILFMMPGVFWPPLPS